MRYRYLYTVGLPEYENPEIDFCGHELLKHDLETGSTQVRDSGEDSIVGEFVFINRNVKSQEKSEDVGWLMGLVLNKKTETAGLYILDADNINGDPQAIAHIPDRIHVGFHGNWVPDRQVTAQKMRPNAN
jgi:carotenoid cleavage dioxygenase-like enzyme